jgi:hypothetical protein
MDELINFVIGFSTCLLPIAFFAVAIVIIVVSTAAMRRNINEGWGSLAQRTGLTLEEVGPSTPFGRFGTPEVRGDFEGRAVKLWTYTVRHGRSSTRYTTMQMSLKNPSNYKLSIRRQTGLDGIGKALGMQDIEIGDAEFDREFVIKSTPETVAKALFGGGSMVREAVRRVPRGGIEINGATMIYKQTNLLTDSEALYNILNSLREIANAIEDTSSGEREGFAGDRTFQEEEVKPESIWGDKSNFGDKDEYGTKDSYGADDVDPSYTNDPFYQKKPQPDLYGKAPNDPFGPPPTAQTNWKPILIGAFILFDLICFGAIAFYFFFGQ